MRHSFQSSIVFRLWLALSVIAIVFTTIAFGLHVWLTVEANIAAAHGQTKAKVQAVIAAAARFGVNDSNPTAGDTRTAEGLGIVSIDVISPAGETLTRINFSSRRVIGPPLDQELLNRSEPIRSRTFRFRGNSYDMESISPLGVMRGGSFGEEHVVPFDSLIPDASGYLRLFVQYPDLTAAAKALVLRSCLAASIILGAILFGMWPFLNHLVSRPLRRYSALAMQIAVGLPARMPANGGGELGELGRAVNSMADALEHRATVDALTGLFNLRHLSSKLEALIGEAAATESPLCLIVGDLDNLKPVNDTYGHQAGDRVLQAVASAIQRWAGQEFTCWRLGGDEFVVALPGAKETEGFVWAAELHKLVASIGVPMEGTLIRPSMSVGVATYPKDGDSSGALLRIADRRMYAAKARRAEERRLTGSPAA